MNYFKLVVAGLKHYAKSHLWVVVAVSISTAVLSGALIVGDSVIFSLQQATRYRLGNITHVFSGGDRFFEYDLATRLSDKFKTNVASVLKMDGVASTEGGAIRLGDVHIWGVAEGFGKTAGGSELFDSISRSEVLISSNFAARMNLKAGDRFLLLAGSTGVIPSNAPFVSDEDQNNPMRVTVKSILENENLDRLSLKTSQTAPFNVFVNYNYLSEANSLSQKANALLISTEKDHEEIFQEIKNVWNNKDAGLQIKLVEDVNEWSITSDRIFIDRHVVSNLVSHIPRLQPRLCYFVNEINNLGRTTPYSFICGIQNQVSDNEIVINEWLANNLQIQLGDSVELKYFSIGPLRVLAEQQAYFKVVKIVPLKDAYADRTLMPDLPGLSDVGNCRDWDTGVPINLGAIRDVDEKYWDDYQGTPKAFVSQSMAEKLWANRFGSATVLRMSSSQLSEDELAALVSQNVQPELMGFAVDDVLDKGMNAANNGTDFGQLFLGLSFFIIFSGILLTAMLFVLGMEQRTSQIGTLRAIGLSGKLIQRLFFMETAVIVCLGSVIGIALAIAYNEMIFLALNKLWFDIVRTTVLETSIQLPTLFTGFAVSVLISFITIWFMLKRQMRRSVIQQHKSLSGQKTKFSRAAELFGVFLLTSLSLVLVGIDLVNNQSLNPSTFFAAGGALLLAFLLYNQYLLNKVSQKSSQQFNWKQLASKNRTINSKRSITQIALLAIGTYLVISTGANRQDLFEDAHLKESGTGGFKYVAESTMPVLEDMNSGFWRQKEAVQSRFKAVAFRATSGDDASCLNLNRISNPRILGVDPSLLNGRFSFVTSSKDLDDTHPWLTLNKAYDDVIPAIADQTVIQWGLGKKVGDTLIYRDAKGEILNIKLVGGLAGSVFQGNIIISENAFLEHFPSSSGANFFLLDQETEQDNNLAEELQLLFRDKGWHMVLAAERLAEFKSVENTYLSIFLVLGGLGLLIGTFGFAAALKRSLVQRQSEIALLISQGFGAKMTTKIIRREVNAIFFSGIGGGTIAALISTAPLFKLNTTATLFLIAQIVFALLVVGVVSIRWIISKSIKNHNLMGALRSE